MARLAACSAAHTAAVVPLNLSRGGVPRPMVPSVRLSQAHLVAGLAGCSAAHSPARLTAARPTTRSTARLAAARSTTCSTARLADARSVARYTARLATARLAACLIVSSTVCVEARARPAASPTAYSTAARAALCSVRCPLTCAARTVAWPTAHSAACSSACPAACPMRAILPRGRQCICLLPAARPCCRRARLAPIGGGDTTISRTPAASKLADRTPAASKLPEFFPMALQSVHWQSTQPRLCRRLCRQQLAQPRVRCQQLAPRLRHRQPPRR